MADSDHFIVKEWKVWNSNTNPADWKKSAPVGTGAVMNIGGWEGDVFTEGILRMTPTWLRSKSNSIDDDTLEVQLNIVAKRVLALCFQAYGYSHRAGKKR